MTTGDWGPGKTAFDDRVRRAGKRFVLAHGFVPAVTLVAYVVALPVGDRAEMWPAVVFYALVVGLLVWWARKQALRPGRWVGAASWSGGIAGFFLGSPVLGASGLFDDVAMSRNPGRILGVMVGALLGGALLGWFVSRSLARWAERTVLEPFDDALLKSTVELSWRARGDRRLSLTIGTDDVSLRGNYSEARRFTKTHALVVVTEARPALSDKDLPGVHVEAAGDEWFFPTDEGDDVLRALRVRSQAVAR